MWQRWQGLTHRFNLPSEVNSGMAVVSLRYVQSPVMSVSIPCGPGDPGTPGGPGKPSLPGGPGGPWPLDAKMPAGVFWTVIELEILSAEWGKLKKNENRSQECTLKSKWNEVSTFKDSQNLLPDEYPEFLHEARIVLFVATKSKWSVPGKSNAALSQLSKNRAQYE